ncbi:uncharacterized protein TrAFT101_002485 [Trichoderma asperellum]|uniref:uncharacterized protein n=1 Tax=Trichoderma asperellum TaxID=101201 RepID=UPI00332AD6BD|nr:hypothetical protein TrAFT101_002485 [Trichoderma asperellum]
MHSGTVRPTYQISRSQSESHHVEPSQRRRSAKEVQIVMISSSSVFWRSAARCKHQKSAPAAGQIKTDDGAQNKPLNFDQGNGVFPSQAGHDVGAG